MFSRLIIITLAVLLIGCAPTPTPTPMPTVTPVPPTATAIPTTALALAPTNTPIPPTATRVTPSNTPTLGTSPLKGDAANGIKLFSKINIECDSCHDVSQPFPGGEYAPNLGNIATEAERVIASPNYTGKAKTVPEYLRESILMPNVYVVPGDNYSEKDGKSAMEQRFAERLAPQELADLVAYLLTLK